MIRRAWMLLAAFSAPVFAKSPPPVDAYDLFHPVPREKMREMHTDRPDTTESAYTVDVGHLQIEMDFARYSRDSGSEAWAFATTNFKLGLTSRLDLQVVVPAFQRVRGGAEGFGDLTFRLKANLWGNGGGSTAMAVMPFLKLPTAADGLGNDEVEGGLIIPFAAELPGGWGFGAMLEVDFLADEDGRYAEWIASATVGRDLIGDLGGFLELVSVASEREGWAATFNAGLTYALTEDIQLDAGVGFGLTEAAEDFGAFAGMSIRF